MKGDKDLLDKIAEKFKEEALEYIDSEVLSGSEGEEENEKVRETIKGVVLYCIDEAKKHARSPKELQNEFETCLKEWFSTTMIISNKFLKRLVKESK